LYVQQTNAITVEINVEISHGDKCKQTSRDAAQPIK